MINIKQLWNYIIGNYEGLMRNVNNKIQDLEQRKIDYPEQVSYCEALISDLQSQIEELQRKIDTKARNN